MRIAYAPGSAQLVAGGGALAVLPADAPIATVEDVWERLERGDDPLESVVDALSRAFGPGSDALPSFAVVARDDAGARVVLRGDLAAVIARPDGEERLVPAPDEPHTTWRLDEPHRLSLALSWGAPEPSLPFVSGVALAGALKLTFAAAEPAVYADGSAQAPAGAVEAAHDVPDPEPEPDADAPEPAARPVEPAASPADSPAPEPDAPELAAPPVEPAAPPAVVSAPTPPREAPVIPPRPAAAEPVPPVAEEAPVPAADPEPSVAPAPSVPAEAPPAPPVAEETAFPESDTTGLSPVGEATELPEPEEDDVDPAELEADTIVLQRDRRAALDTAARIPEISGAVSARAAHDEPQPVPAESLDLAPAPLVAPAGDHDGRTISARAAAALRGAGRAAAEVPAAAPARRPRPRVRVSNGAVVELDRPVVIGRRPRSTRPPGAEMPHLIAVESPQHDISRNHVEIRAEDDSVIVIDLHSTNGTTLWRDDDDLRLHPGEQTVLIPGDTLDLGDGITVSFEDLP